MAVRSEARRARTRSSSRHTDWLSLIEISGPFLTLPVLDRVFPQGLDARDQDVGRELRTRFAEWEAEQEKRRPDRAIHQGWIRWVLTDVLEYRHATLAEGQALPASLEARIIQEGETLRPDLALLDQDAKKPVLLIQIYDAEQNLGRVVEGKRWKAEPGTRMAELLRATAVPLGLVTNGERWMLVHALKDETTGFASWYANLWLDEPQTLRAFTSLLGVERFFGKQASLPELLKESAQNQQDVTDKLGLQVREAVELLVQAIDRIDKDRGRELLRGFSEQRLYEATLAVMMRLVFLLSAEERGLLRLGDPIWDANYAVSTLGAQLREEADRHGEELLERRSDAWARLLATFRAVHGGVRHEALNLPAYGGALFDPDRYPFLEGRPRDTGWRQYLAQPLPITNRTVLHLLEALQYLRERGGEARRLSYLALDIEQIGHVYEGLLDHTARRAKEPMLGIEGGTEKSLPIEPEVPLDAMEQALAQGGAEAVTELLKSHGAKKTTSAVEKALATEADLTEVARLRVACDNDEPLLTRVRPFWGLLRTDREDRPAVILPGSIFVTKGTDRRSSGTHYTPTSLTEPIVRHTLDPLVYRGMADGVEPSPETLIEPDEILALKVVDFACGSGAFLVQACRYLAAKLVEAWERREAEQPGRRLALPEALTSRGNPSERLLPADPEERLALARRLVADRCLYGVDRNPMATEMAKLSLWLVTLQKDRPFEFLDHAIKWGDSLLGVTSLEQLETFHLYPVRGRALFRQMDLIDDVRVAAEVAIRQASDKRRRLEAFAVNDIVDAEEKARLHAEAEAALTDVRLIADLMTGAAISGVGDDRDRSLRQLDAELERLAPLVGQALDSGPPEGARANARDAIAAKARELLDAGKPDAQPPRRCFHWPIEFPEVLDRENSGFDALISNPPFQGGQKITGEHGTDYRHQLVQHIAEGRKGSADLCAYFYLRAAQIIRTGGQFGQLATNTIAQGDTREVGLDAMARSGIVIPRAVPSRKWPGTAGVDVAQVWMHKGPWQDGHVLDNKPVKAITSYLSSPGKVVGDPQRLAANAGRSFQGSIVLGMGFVLTREEARELIDKNPCNDAVLFPYLSGDDLNSRLDQSPSRWVINFFDWPLQRSAEGSWRKADDRQRQRWLRDGCVPSDYPDQVAADYPDCLSIVEAKVRPERQRLRPNGHYVLRKPLPQKWWIYAEKRPALYSTVADMQRFLVHPLTSKHHTFVFVSHPIVVSHMTVTIACDDWSSYCVLQSEVHWQWALRYGNKLETRPQYTNSDCFETFPLPGRDPKLGACGETYYASRSELARSRQHGLAAIYNLLDQPDEAGADITKLRELQIAMDRAVIGAYGWDDLDLGHGFHETRQGVRFTISDSAREEVLDRLLALNHERYAEEVRQGRHEKGTRKKARGQRKSEPAQAGHSAMQPDLGFDFRLTTQRAARR